MTSHAPLHTMSFTKQQTWNATVMANIWSKRHILDTTQISYIKALYDNAKANNRYNVSTFTYSYSKNSIISRTGYGRLYSQQKGSLERLEKSLRHSLCAGLYWDIDMVNAQPTILSQLATKHGLNLTLLDYYVTNRESVIANFMSEYNLTRTEVKDMFIQCLFGSSTVELKSLQRELKVLANELRTEYHDLYDKVIKMKEKNIIGTFLAYIAQSEECKCLLAMNEYFTKKGRSVDVFCYDGCMILIINGETKFPDELLRGCERFIFDTLGYSIMLQVKEMKCAEEFSNPNAKLLRLTDIDDVFMARKFISKMNGNIIRDEEYGVMVFEETIGFWNNDTEILRTYIINADLVEETMDGVVNYSGYAYKQDIIIKLLPALLPSINFCEIRINKTIGKLLFNDGIYDMITKTFTKGFDKNMYFTGRIKRDFPVERNYDIIQKINTLLFEDPFRRDEQDVGIYLKQLIARGIAGHYEDKTLIWAIGETNSGKGVQSTALIKCFNTFVSSFDPNCLLYNKHSGADEAKKLAWIYPIHNSRIAVGNEGRPIGCMDSGIIKSLVSGGDALKMRKNFKDEESRINRSTPILFSNDMPKFMSADEATINRIKIYEYKLSFVYKAPEDLETWERLAIPIKDMFDDVEYQNAYFWCIMDAYLPTVPRPCKTALASAKLWVPPPKLSFLSCLQEAGYKIVKGEETLYVPFSELKYALLQGGIANGMTDQAIGRELNKLGLETSEARINGKVTKIRKYITRVE